MKTVVALYDRMEDANRAVRDLVDLGIARTDISLMASDAAGEYGSSLQAGEGGAAATGAGIGAVAGGLGGLVIGLGILAIPGVGPVLAAGPLASAIAALTGAGVGALAGGAAGGLLGAMADLGIPEESAGNYAEGVRRGGILVTVRVDDNWAEEVQMVMNRNNVVNLDERVSTWRDQGWTGYDPNTHVGTYAAEGSLQEAGSGNIQDRIIANSTPSGGQPVDDQFYRYDPDFRNYYITTLGARGHDYEYYEPAYQYGYQLARDERYRDWTWDDVEPEARRDWEQRQGSQGAWEDFKDAVQYSWMRVKQGIQESLD